MDDSLDDFFAKKDKSSKKKGKSGRSKLVVADLLPATTPTPPNEPSDNVENIVQQVAEVKIGVEQDAEPGKEKKRKKKKDKDGTDSSSRKEDGEWHTVEEADYTGLRISTKNTVQEANDAAENAARSEPEYDEDGQIIEKNSDGKVWKMMPADTEESVYQEAPAPIVVIQEMPNVTGGRYIPPSRRSGGAASTELTPVSMKRPMRKKKAPNMNSQEDFPTLGTSAVKAPSDYDSSAFETVRGGGSSQPVSTHAGSSRLETSNMYSALDRR